MTISEEQYFSRQRALDAAGLAVLRRSSVAVVGTGNIGGPLAFELARAGVARITVIDHGLVEAENLSRGIFTAADVGMRKVDAVARRIAADAPFTTVTPVFGDVRVDVPESVLLEQDVVGVGTDSWSSRMFVNRQVHQFPGRTKAIVSGGMTGLNWEVMVSVPGSGLGCAQCPHGEKIEFADEDGGCSTSGGAVVDQRVDASVSFVGLSVAAQMAAEIVNALTRKTPRLAGRMLSFDAERFRFDIWKIAPDPTCTAHRALGAEDYITIPAGERTVRELRRLVADRLRVRVRDVALATDRQLVHTRRCVRCDLVEPVHRPLLTYRKAPPACRRCGATDFDVEPDTLLTDDAMKVSDAGIPTGKILRAHVGLRVVLVVPESGG